MMGTLVSLAITCLGAAAASGAPPPAACADGARGRAYQLGHRQGESFVESAWSSVKRDCGDRSGIEQTVRDALANRTLPARASEVLRCRYLGFTTGAHEALEHITTQCSGTATSPGGRS